MEYFKEHKKTFFLKLALMLILIPIVFISCFAAPALIHEGIVNDEVNLWYVLPFGILMGLVLIPVGVAVYQAERLLILIEKKEYYSLDSAKRLNIIKTAGLVATILFTAMLPSVFYFTEVDDAPGMAMLGLVFVFASAGVTVFASVVRDLVLEKVNES